MESSSGSSRDASCPPWCALHHEQSPDYWVHEAPAAIVRSDFDVPVAKVRTVMGTVSGEDFGPQVQVDLVTNRVVEKDGDHTFAQAALSPDVARRLAAALSEAADTLDGYPRA